MKGRPLLLAMWVAGLAVASAPALAQTFQKYQCSDGAEFVLSLFPERRMAYVQLDGKHLSLPQRRLAFPGSKRYSLSGVSISTRGEAATLKRGGKRSDCDLVQAN